MDNLTWHDHRVTRSMRSGHKAQHPCLLWFTGLSGAGKSTLANALEYKLFQRQQHTYLLDGDNVRHGLNKDLGFTDEDRVENIRRIGEASKLFVDAGLIVMSAFISPFCSDRNLVRSLFNPDQFIEVYVATSLAVCEERDPKGLYKKARRGEIQHFTGIDSPYEIPKSPEVTINTAENTVDECVAILINYMIERDILKP